MSLRRLLFLAGTSQPPQRTSCHAELCPTACYQTINCISPIVGDRNLNLGWSLFETIFSLPTGHHPFLCYFKKSSSVGSIILFQLSS